VPPNPPLCTGPDDPRFAELLIGSHLRLTGRPLIPGPDPADPARWLYREAPFGLLAHEPGDDPVFRYANRAAQRAFGYSWDEFDGLPSRLSAAPADRDERARLLAEVGRDGYSDAYRGVRIARDGGRFWIEDATVWNLLDAGGGYRGQAAVFRSVTPISGPA
jgi:PAS domain S-box-containing protein